VAGIRDACGWDIAISADANMGWTSIRRAFSSSMLFPQIALLEQPLATSDIAVRSVCPGRDDRTGGDEGIHGLEDLTKEDAEAGVRWFG